MGRSVESFLKVDLFEIRTTSRNAQAHGAEVEVHMRLYQMISIYKYIIYKYTVIRTISCYTINLLQFIFQIPSVVITSVL